MRQGGVLECAAVGVPDPHSGEAVKLFAVKKDPNLTERRAARLHDRRGSPATRCRDTSNSAPNCRRPMSARSCAARCATTARTGAIMTDATPLATPPRSSRSGARPDRTAGSRRTTPSTTKSAGAFWRRTRRPPPASSPTWESNAEGALALLILLDQFPRNMFRGYARAFATDPLARAITAARCCAASTRRCRPTLRGFFYLPFEHSEDLADQERGAGALYRRRRRRRPEMGGDARRHHPPLRPLSASQRRARPRDHAGGAGVPRRAAGFAG